MQHAIGKEKNEKENSVFAFDRAVVLTLLVPSSSVRATTLFNGYVNNNATCGSGGCFGLTYELTITDRADLNPTTFDATVEITGTYTGSLPFIAAVDFKPDGNTVTSATLTSAPGSIGGWTTNINNGQAGNDCSGSGTGFICSFDTGTNSLAPTGPGPLDYTWTWDFIMTGTLAPGHLGARFNDASGTANGNIISASSFDGIPGTGRVPEPSSMVLLGAGLSLVASICRRIRSLHK